MTEEKERRGCALTLASHATCSDRCLTSASNFGTKNSDNRKQMITEETAIRQMCISVQTSLKEIISNIRHQNAQQSEVQ